MFYRFEVLDTRELRPISTFTMLSSPAESLTVTAASIYVIYAANIAMATWRPTKRGA